MNQMNGNIFKEKAELERKLAAVELTRDVLARTMADSKGIYMTMTRILIAASKAGLLKGITKAHLDVATGDIGWDLLPSGEMVFTVIPPEAAPAEAQQ